MDVFKFREHLVGEYAGFSRSFTRLRSDDIREFVDREYASQRYWPEPLIQINPTYRSGGTVDELVAGGQLSPECSANLMGEGAANDDGIALAGLEPGTLQNLEPGEDIKFSDPADVGGSYSEFLRTQFRAVAAAIGVTYEQLTGDLTGVNYSSIRAGMLGSAAAARWSNTACWCTRCADRCGRRG